MGFLDNSTNNIIVDAVLTDLGREKLANQTFSIDKFAFGDDEVDYTIIKKFGRTVGKQKIELNTPIFEAQTNQNTALKYRLLSYNSPTLSRLPSLQIQGESSVINMTTTQGATSTKTLKFEQTVTGESTIDSDTVDRNFLVTLNTRFLSLLPASRKPTHTDSDGISQYVVSAVDFNDQLGGILEIKLAVKTLSDNVFTFYGDQGNKTRITTQVSVQGLESGARVDTTVAISK